MPLTITLDFVVPPVELADHIGLFYHFRTDQLRFSDTERAGLAQLRFRTAGSHSRYAFADGTSQSVGALHLLGPTTGSTLSSAHGPIEVVGMGLTPAGWAALVGSDASTMVNRAIDCDELFAGSAAVASALAGARESADKIAIVTAFVGGLIEGRGAGVGGFVRQVDAWLAGSPSPALEDLEAATGLSRRQVERRCNALYGAPPKVLARKYRALRAAVALVAERASVADLLARGFYDQSHLIREIKHFTGCTPRQLRADPPLLALATIEGRVALPGVVPPLIRET